MLTACASGFEVTHSFQTPAEANAKGGGGGCSGDVFIASQAIPFNAAGVAGRASGVFVRDFWCASGPVAISIGERSYTVEPVAAASNADFARLTGFQPVYENPRQDLRVELKHLEQIREVFDKRTDCTTRYHRLQVTVRFKGTTKTMEGFTGGGCP